jgi:hypothetical protein
MKIIIIILLGLFIKVQGGRSQGFVNLDFESATVATITNPGGGIVTRQQFLGGQ